MNKRIRKKRLNLGDYHIGDHVYTRKEITMINKANIGYMNVRALYYNIKDPKLTRPRVKALINYIYKNRLKHVNMSFKHLRFARHLNESHRVTANDIFNYRTSITSASTKEVENKPRTIPGGKKMKYNSSTFISTTRSAANSCEAASMEVD